MGSGGAPLASVSVVIAFLTPLRVWAEPQPPMHFVVIVFVFVIVFCLERILCISELSEVANYSSATSLL